MKKVIFEGYYGNKNTGDDAFVEVSSWGALKHWGNNNCVFLATTLPETISKTYHIKKQLFRGQNKIETIFHIYSAKAFISSGGSTFENIFPKYHPKNIALRAKAILRSYKIGGIGVSLGPYKDMQTEKKIIEYLKRMDFLCLRDEYSYKMALNYDLPYEPINAFDIAALLPQIYGKNVISDKNENMQEKIIGISICYFERYRIGYDLNNEERRNEYIKNLILEISIKTSAKLRFFEFNGNQNIGDRLITKKVIEFLKSKNIENTEFIPYNCNTYFIYKKVVECDILISSRLHASIFACFASIPFFLIEYHRKCTDFLNSVGYHQQYRLFDGRKDISQTIEQISNILENKNNYVPPTNVQICIDKATKNFTSITL